MEMGSRAQPSERKILWGGELATQEGQAGRRSRGGAVPRGASRNPMSRKISVLWSIRRMLPQFLCLFLACAAAGQAPRSSAALLIMRRQSVPVAVDVERSL